MTDTLIAEGIPPLWFLAPEGFFALPLSPGAEQVTERVSAFVRELYSRGDASVWEPALPYYTAIADMMGSAGLSYAALGLFSTAEEADTPDGSARRHEPSEGVAQCALTVGIVATDHAGQDTDVVAQGILATLSADPYNDAVWLDLPCGPAVTCVTLRQHRLGPEVTADAGETELLTGQIQVYIPFPTGPCTAVFTLYTASMDHWAEIYRLMSAVLRTVSFSDPAEEGGSEPSAGPPGRGA